MLFANALISEFLTNIYLLEINVTTMLPTNFKNKHPTKYNGGKDFYILNLECGA